MEVGGSMSSSYCAAWEYTCMSTSYIQFDRQANKRTERHLLMRMWTRYDYNLEYVCASWGPMATDLFSFKRKHFWNERGVKLCGLQHHFLNYEQSCSACLYLHQICFTWTGISSSESPSMTSTKTLHFYLVKMLSQILVVFLFDIPGLHVWCIHTCYHLFRLIQCTKYWLCVVANKQRNSPQWSCRVFENQGRKEKKANGSKVTLLGQFLWLPQELSRFHISGEPRWTNSG